MQEAEQRNNEQEKQYQFIQLTTALEQKNIDDVEISESTKEIDLTAISNVYDIVEQECNVIGLDPALGKTLIDTESGFRKFAHNGNTNGSYDSGLAQLNNRGEPLEHYFGKNITLADGTTVRVTRYNYKTNARLNVAMGVRRYKSYLDDLGNPFSAYACYNIGNAVKRILKNHKKSDVATIITAIRKAGFGRGADNLKNNFLPKFKKWTGGTFYK